MGDGRRMRALGFYVWGAGFCSLSLVNALVVSVSGNTWENWFRSFWLVFFKNHKNQKSLVYWGHFGRFIGVILVGKLR